MSVVDDYVTLPRELVAALIDMALTGDAGMSGWMDDEQVDGLRAAATAIGMDPMAATPRNFKCKHRGSHSWRGWITPAEQARLPRIDRYRVCDDCREYEYATEEKKP